MPPSHDVPGAPQETLADSVRAPHRHVLARARILERIAEGASLRDFMTEVVSAIEELSPPWSATAHLVSEGTRLTRGVSPSLPEAVVQLELLSSEDAWAGAHALSHRAPALFRLDDVALPEPLRRLLGKNAFRSATLLPALTPRGQVVAALMVFDEGTSPVAAGVDAFLETAASLLALGVERLRVLDRLRLAQSSIDESRVPAVCLREDGSFLYANDAACRAVGYPRSELLRMRVFELDPKATMPRFRRIWRVLARRGHVELETDIEREDGSLLPVSFAASLVRLETESYACALVRDITELREAEEQIRDCESRIAIAEQRLEQDGLHDDLTGLPSRSTFLDHLRRSLERAKRSRADYRFAVLFLDFDRFKRVNDSLGHMAGDRLLVAVSRRLSTCVRPGDTVARLGGDEFAILVDRVGEVSEATRVAERIHESLREPFVVHGVEVFVTTSVGIALGSSGYERPEDLLHDADTAMYRAKAGGNARHEIFDEEMHASAMEQLRLEAELRRAVNGNEFRLVYQPILSMRERTPTGFEAFARWHHPTRGLLAPSAFLQAAESSGWIVDIGWWVLAEACRQARTWQERFGRPSLRVHVNLSDRQLFHSELSARIEHLLEQTGLPPEGLVLDVPENVVMQRADRTVAILSRLKALGVLLHLDDFGTGYSSLGYLHRFQLDALKIDRAFVRHLHPKGENWVTVRAIVNLAQNVGMEVIAEGVETEEQREHLLELGCTLGQGSLFHDPLPPDEAARIIG